jgi:hypothetical protein
MSDFLFTMEYAENTEKTNLSTKDTKGHEGTRRTQNWIYSVFLRILRGNRILSP